MARKPHSQRHGNAPSPYFKYGKRPFKYGALVSEVYERAAKVGASRKEEPRGRKNA